MPVQLTPEAMERLAVQILTSPKYSWMGLPKETVLDLLVQEMPMSKDLKHLIKRIRAKLHNICAPYLGDLDYRLASDQISKALATKDVNLIQATCRQFLDQHASTRERFSILEEFYRQLFIISGTPKTILDLACGLNPFSFPWMRLDEDTQYYAYDIHQPRIELINHFFEGIGLLPLASVQDILINPPRQPADVALLLKEAHRIEQRQRGAARILLQQIRAKWIFVSLPVSSLHGQRDLNKRMRNLMHSVLKGLPWEIRELEIENELVFCIHP